jgi:hypothetical protein
MRTALYSVALWRKRRVSRLSYWYRTTLHDAHLRHGIAGASVACSCALPHNVRPLVGQTLPADYRS